MNTDLKVLKAIQLTTAATASASCDTAGCGGLKLFAVLGVSTTTTLTASLEISAYDSTAASSGTSLTTIIGTTEIAAFTLNADPRVILVDLNGKNLGRYLYAKLTNNGKAESALLFLGTKLEDGAETAAKAGVTTLVTAEA
jgi:hypothetical protein